ncbi:hypothetical protein WJX77_006309 [Trebouxia sp. C0004]
MNNLHREECQGQEAYAHPKKIHLYKCCPTGEELHPHIQSSEPNLAPKITGMLLEMPESEIIILIEDQLACRDKV